MKRVPFLTLISATFALSTLLQGRAVVCAGEKKMSEKDYIRGVSLYTEGNGEAAYPLLEGVFADGTSSLERRFEAATILAYASNSLLKLNKRHVYAKFILNDSLNIQGHGESTALFARFSSKTVHSLLRIAGDGFFDERRFDLATPYYTRLAADQDARNAAYAEYRLGWIDLNQEHPERAFSRWVGFLSHRGEALFQQDQDLYRSMVKDSGKAWVETREADESFSNDSVLNFKSISQFSQVENEFVEGIVLGLKRVSRVEVVEAIRSSLQAVGLAESVFNKLLQKGILFNTFPCEVIQWASPLGRFSPEKLQAEPRVQILSILNRCAENTVLKKQCGKSEGTDLASFFDKLTLSETELPPRISLSVECKNWAPACRDLVSLATQTVTHQDHALDAEKAKSLFEVCSQLDSRERASLQQDMVGMFSLYSDKGLLGTSADASLAKLFEVQLTDSAFRRAITTACLASPTGFSKGILPALTLKALSFQEREQMGEAWLSHFAPAPLSSPWILLLESVVKSQLEQKQSLLAKAVLEKYLPLPLALDVPAGAALWEAYWLFLTDEEHAAEREHVQTHLSALSIGSLSKARINQIFGIVLSYQMTEFAWAHWKEFQRSGALKSALVEAFYQKSLQELTDLKLSPEVLKKYSAGSLIVRVFEKDPSLTPQQVLRVFPKGSSILTDLKAIEKLRAISKNLKYPKLKLNNLLAKVLTNKLDVLKQEEKILEKTAWTSVSYVEKAKDVFIKDSQTLVSELETLQLEIASQSQLVEFSMEISAIKTKIVEKVAALKAQTAVTQKVGGVKK